MLTIESGDKDDPGFVRLVEDLLCGLLRERRLETARVVAIDNWFDRKWLGFSGNGLVRFDAPPGIPGVAIRGHRMDQVVPPPFTPNRVRHDCMYRWCGYAERFLYAYRDQQLHRRRQSFKNLHNRLVAFEDNQAFLWYSGNTAQQDKGSVLVHAVQGGQVTSWYASLERRQGWACHALEGMARSLFDSYLATGRRLRAERSQRIPSEEEVLGAKLHQAIARMEGLAIVAERLLDQPDLEFRNETGKTPFLAAIGSDQYDVARLLLRAGANPYAQDVHGWGALHSIAYSEAGGGERATMLQQCLDRGVAVDARILAGRTALHLAVQREEPSISAQLLDAGADVHAKNGMGGTALHDAVSAGRIAQVAFLLERGAKVGARTKARATPLHYAAMGDEPEILEVLVRAGASLEAKSRTGRDALGLAQLCGHDAVVRVIQRLASS